MVRTTRSSARLAAAPAKEAPVAVKKTVIKKAAPKKDTKKSDHPKVVDEKDHPAESPAAPATSAAEDTGDEKKTGTDDQKKTVAIEACKQWGAFKTRANTIVKAVGDKAKISINAEKPGKGNFVVRVSGQDAPLVELLGLKRPFPPLKALDMEEVCEKVLQAIEA
jgi:hypothetical protein